MKEHVLHDEADLAEVLADARPLPERHLGELLIEANIISEAQLDEALQRQRRGGSRHLGELLVETGAATEQQIHEALADKFGIPIVRLADYVPGSDVLALVPPEVVLQYNVLPLGLVDGRLVTAGRPAHDIKRTALSQAMAPLTENALRLAREGRTSLQEVFNVRLE
ncbi:MAG TPA: hypothetical protein VKA76_13380 [Gammaproteobacteria bacterium]|nr:hypothetical protein [Gammaproteobacteria bacterium]